MATCKVCKKQFSNTNICPDCGAKYTEQDSISPMLLGGVGVVALFVLFVAVSSNDATPTQSQSTADRKSNDRAAIGLCWEDHQKKSLEPSTQRLVASTCEMMERQFVEKYNHKP